MECYIYMNLLMQSVEKKSGIRFEFGADGLSGGARRSVKSNIGSRRVEPLWVLKA